MSGEGRVLTLKTNKKTARRWASRRKFPGISFYLFTQMFESFFFLFFVQAEKIIQASTQREFATLPKPTLKAALNLEFTVAQSYVCQ